MTKLIRLKFIDNPATGNHEKPHFLSTADSKLHYWPSGHKHVSTPKGLHAVT